MPRERVRTSSGVRTGSGITGVRAAKQSHGGALRSEISGEQHEHDAAIMKATSSYQPIMLGRLLHGICFVLHCVFVGAHGRRARYRIFTLFKWLAAGHTDMWTC